MAVMQRDDDSKQSADDDDDYDDVDGDVGERLATSSQLCAVADCCTAEEAPVSARRRRRQGQGHWTWRHAEQCFTWRGRQALRWPGHVIATDVISLFPFSNGVARIWRKGARTEAPRLGRRRASIGYKEWEGVFPFGCLGGQV